jgi:phage terminase large subunit GpA-like protein
MALDAIPTTLDEVGADPRGLKLALWRARIASLAPPPRMTPSEWAEDRVKLSRQTSSQAGKLRLFPFQRGILDAFAEEGAEVIAFQKSARVGYTQMLALGIGYYLEHSASPILSVFPAEQDARYFEKTYIRPLVHDTECLTEILPDLEEQQWHSKVTLRGSSLEMKQAVKYDSFRAFNARLSIGDEVDAPGWNPGGGTTGEGDKTALLRKRGESFPDGRMILGSTPTVKGRSRIESWYERGDKRRRFVPCPHCTEANDGELDGFQFLEWGGPETSHGIKWPKGRPDEAFYVCRHCGSAIEETHKAWMDEHGHWAATAEGERGVVSFHINALYSPFKKAAWGRLAEEFVEAVRLDKEVGDKERLQAFINTTLGETWHDLEAEKGLRKAHELGRFAQIYQAAVPEGVKFLTAGADTQSGKTGENSYRELSIYGWGVRERPFLIGHWIIDKAVESQEAEDDLAALLSAPYRGEDGRDYYVQAACIDAGGHYQQETIDFCSRWRQKTRNAARWWPIKGWSAGEGKRGDKIWKTAIGTSSKTYSVDVDRTKDLTFNKLHGGDMREDLIVFPAQPLAGSIPIDADFFEGMTKERKEYLRGAKYPVWKQAKGNEPWDCLQYAFAALQALKTLPAPNPFLGMLDGGLAKRAAPARPAPADPDQDDLVSAPPAPRPAASKPRAKKKGFRVSPARR